VLNYVKRLMIGKRIAGLFAGFGTAIKRRFPGRTLRQRAALFSSWILRPLGIALVILTGILVLFGVYRAGIILRGLTTRDIISIVTAVSLTLARVLATLVIGVIWAVPAGVYIGLRKDLAAKFQPVVQFFASYPAPMLYPLALLVLEQLHVGLGIGAVVLMLLGAQWYILYNTISGAMSLSDDLIGVTRLFDVRGWVLWKNVILPAIAPQLITGIITAAGGAWNASIVAEYVLYKNKILSTTGVGTLINHAIEHNNMRMLFGGTFALIVVVVIINITVWKRLYRRASQLHQLES
jgi:NitT/TauT family transport system permease protein